MNKACAVSASLLAFFSVEAAAQAIPMEDQTFTEFAAQAVRREVGDTPVSIKGPLTLSVGALQANLERVFGFCRSNNSGCVSEIDRYAKGVAQVLKQQNAPVDKSSVRLVVRSSEYIKRAQESLGSDGPTLQAKPLVEGLVSVAVLDTPRAVRPLDDRDLRKLNMSQNQLFELGGENLQATLKPLADSAKPVGSGQIGAIPGGVYEVGRVAILSQWAPLANAQQGLLVIALPTTDMVLYISESTPSAIDALRALSKDTAAKSSNPLSPSTVLKWTAERWMPVQ